MCAAGGRRLYGASWCRWVCTVGHSECYLRLHTEHLLVSEDDEIYRVRRVLLQQLPSSSQTSRTIQHCQPLCAAFLHAFQPQVLVDGRTNTAQHNNIALRCAMLWVICNFHINSNSLKTDQIKSITWSISRLHVCRPTLNEYNDGKIPLRNAGVSGDLLSALVRLRMIFLTQYQIFHRSNVTSRAMPGNGRVFL